MPRPKHVGLRHFACGPVQWSPAASSSPAFQQAYLPRPAGEVSTGDVCTECPLGSFTFNASSECTQCPTGANCFGAQVPLTAHVLTHGVMTVGLPRLVAYLVSSRTCFSLPAGMALAIAHPHDRDQNPVPARILLKGR